MSAVTPRSTGPRSRGGPALPGSTPGPLGCAAAAPPAPSGPGGATASAPLEGTSAERRSSLPAWMDTARLTRGAAAEAACSGAAAASGTACSPTPDGRPAPSMPAALLDDAAAALGLGPAAGGAGAYRCRKAASCGMRPTVDSVTLRPRRQTGARVGTRVQPTGTGKGSPRAGARSQRGATVPVARPRGQRSRRPCRAVRSLAAGPRRRPDLCAAKPSPLRAVITSMAANTACGLWSGSPMP